MLTFFDKDKPGIRVRIKNEKHDIFVKAVKRNDYITSLLRNWLVKTDSLFFNQIKLGPIYDESKSWKNIMQNEAKHYVTWAQNGIKTPSLLFFNGCSIVRTFVEGDTLDKILEKPGTENVYDQFLDKMAQLYKLGDKHKSTDYLHSDPNINNFIYSNKQIIPIDSANILKKHDYSTNKAYLILKTLIDISQLNINQETKQKYLTKFKSIIKDEEIDTIVNFEAHIPIYIEPYFIAREAIVSTAMGRKPKDQLENFRTKIKIYKKRIKPILMA